MPIPTLLGALAPRLDPARSDGLRLQLSLRRTDTGTSYGLAIRSAVAEALASDPPDAALEIHATEPTLRGLLTGRISWPRSVEAGAATLNRGSAEEAARLWSLFDPPVGDLPALAPR